MATFKTFEDIEAWQKARELCKEIHRLVTKPVFSKDFGLVNQIKNSSGSVMDNIAEGFEREGKKEFSQFLAIAKGSCGETQSQLYRALDNRYIDEAEFQKTVQIANETKAKIKGLMNYLKTSEIKGYKFKQPEPQTSNTKLQTSNPHD
ncbi:MAG: four helix bundle protein [Bacteroidia bacterium]